MARGRKDHAVEGSGRGQSLVEMALVLPLLVLLFVVALDLGRGMAAYAAAVHAAREGAWVAAHGQPNMAAVQEAVDRALSEAGLDPARATVSASIGDPGQSVVVTVTYPFEPLLPLFTDTVTLRGTGEMVRMY